MGLILKDPEACRKAKSVTHLDTFIYHQTADWSPNFGLNSVVPLIWLQFWPHRVLLGEVLPHSSCVYLGLLLAVCCF